MKDPGYSFLEEAAAAARKESRKYWAKGGEADTRYPQQKSKGWYIKLVDNPELRMAEAIRRMKGGKP